MRLAATRLREAGCVEKRYCWRTNRSASERVTLPDPSMDLRACWVLACSSAAWRIRCSPLLTVAMFRRSTNKLGSKIGRHWQAATASSAL